MICSNSTRCINPQRSFRGYYHLLSIVHKDACSFRKLDLFTLESLLLQLQKTGPFQLGQPTISLSSVDYIYSKASGICRLARFDRILHPHIRNRRNLPPWADQSNTADDYMFLCVVRLSQQPRHYKHEYKQTEPRCVCASRLQRENIKGQQQAKTKRTLPIGGD